MRRRLIFAFVSMAVMIIALYGVPRAILTADLVQTSQAQRVDRMAILLSALVSERERIGPVTADLFEPLLRAEDGVTYVGADGDTLHVDATADADDLRKTVDVKDGGTLTVTRSGSYVTQLVTDAVTPVILIGVVLLLVSVIGAFLLGRNLSRPFVKLAGTARDLGAGGLSTEPEKYRFPEAAAIDRALRDSADTLERRIRREHEFAANASHQLRTPITAVRLELEDLSLWGETPPVVREQLEHAVQEIDRLADAITQLLALARGEAAAESACAPLEQTIRGAAERWRQQANATGRSIRTDDLDDALGSAPAAASQILDVLLHNAIKHGRGTITITAARRAEYVTVQVADEGPRPSGNSIFQRRPEQRTATSGEGIGLALSAELAESLGGHLLLEGDETTRFSLILPARG